MVAKKITLNGPIPPAASVLPKGVVWKKKAFDDADFVNDVWAFKKQTDPASVPRQPWRSSRSTIWQPPRPPRNSALCRVTLPAHRRTPDEGAEPDDSGN